MMKNRINRNQIYRLIRDKDKLVLIISGILLTAASVVLFLYRYAEALLHAPWEMYTDSLFAYERLDPNDLLRHSGIGIVIYAGICIAMIIYNMHILDRTSNGSYLLKRVPQRFYYYRVVSSYPVRCFIVGVIVAILMEVFFVNFTLFYRPRLINENIAIDFLGLLF